MITGLVTGPVFKYLTGILGIAVIGLSLWIALLRQDVKTLENWQDRVIVAVQNASDNDEVDADTTVDQILRLGRSVFNLREGITEQNHAIEIVAQERDAALERARLERERRQDALDHANRVADTLDEQAEQPAEDSDAAIRAAQDLAYEEGL